MRVIVDQIIESTDNSKKFYREYFGISSETKPTADVACGSSFTEINTGDVYLFNETSQQWVKEFSLQG